MATNYGESDKNGESDNLKNTVLTMMLFTHLSCCYRLHESEISIVF